jgi:hypothetical protein
VEAAEEVAVEATKEIMAVEAEKVEGMGQPKYF